MKRDDLIIVRGGGDLSTGTIHRLWAAGLRVLVLEIENPAAIRRQVALCEAVYTKTTEVEGLRAVRIDRYEEAEAVWQENSVPILIDPKGVSIGALKPAVVIDAILAKRNLGTRRDMAPLTIALGPGFTAGEDVDVVVETKRGHRLGRIIREGAAIPNTGIPGVIGGYGAERVIHAQAAGIFKNVRVIGDIVEAGDLTLYFLLFHVILYYILLFFFLLILLPHSIYLFDSFLPPSTFFDYNYYNIIIKIFQHFLLLKVPKIEM